MSNTPKPLGPPTKYRDDIPSQLLEYFRENRVFKVDGRTYPEFNSIEGFCAKIEIAKSTFYEWFEAGNSLIGNFMRWQLDTNIGIDSKITCQ